MQKARERLQHSKNLFYIQLQILRTGKVAGNRIRRIVKCRMVGNTFNDFYFSHLPFSLIMPKRGLSVRYRRDLKRRKADESPLARRRRQLAKTLVALMCPLLAKDNGFQTCIMRAHRDIGKPALPNLTAMLCKALMLMFACSPVSTTLPNAVNLHAALQDGTVNILVGTHCPYRRQRTLCQPRTSYYR